MRKSSLILMLAMAFVLSLAAASFSAGIPDITPAGCSDYEYGMQIKYGAPANGSCPTFDYELGSGTAPYACYEGYCSSHNVEGVILHVCDCDDLNDILIDAAKIPTSVEVGFRLTIVGDGVYWTDENFTDTGSSLDKNILVQSFTTDSYEADNCLSFSPGGMIPYDAKAGTNLWDFSDNCNVACCFKCQSQLATVIETGLDYQFVGPSINDRYILIDMPTMVWDSSVVDEGDVVQVEIEVIYKECDPCGEVDVCKYIVDVGTFTECMTYPCYMCLPYIIGNMDGDADAWTGIAVTNPTPVAQEAIVTFYAGADADGPIKFNETIEIDPYAVGEIIVQSLSFIDDLPGTLFASVALTGCGQAYVINQYEGGLQGYLGLRSGYDRAIGDCDEHPGSNPCTFCGIANKGAGCQTDIDD